MNTGNAIGRGDGLLTLEVAGRVTAEDKQHIQSVSIVIQKGDGSRVEYPAHYDGFYAQAEVTFDVEGEWRAGILVHFDNGRKMTSYDVYTFLVTDGFPVN